MDTGTVRRRSLGMRGGRSPHPLRPARPGRRARNTVRHRLARVGELLVVDLQDPGVRMELWFTLQWLPDEAVEAEE
ncbi:MULTISPECIES: helix-turn-helix domain-containing protein [unclassified Streptomyces]|uniref:helix-turn-helix domain-containing protein n=1 Tax=unclassified Streptomyces TaxID=2593676 RepID=UPI003651D9EC